MKILVVTQYFWPEQFRINDLTQMFVERGHDVTILTGVPNYPAGLIFPEFKAHEERYSEYHGMKVLRVPMVARGQKRVRLVANYLSFALSATVIGSWRLRRQSYDIIFVYQASPVTVGFPAMFLRRLKKAPSCMLIMDLWPETPIALGILPFKFLQRLVGSFVKLIYRSTDLLLIQSPAFETSVRRYAPKNAEIRYFPSWADAVFDAQLPEPAPEVPRSPESFSVLFAGNIGEAQDFESVLAAAELVRERADIRFLIVGDGRVLEWVENEVRARGLSLSVLLLGRHPVERMPEFFAHADALLVSLRADPVFSATIPAKVQAYMASGLPIVGLLDGEGAEVVRRWDCGISAPSGDPAGLAAAILKLADSPIEVRKRMGENGRSGAATEFNRHILMDKLVQWMSELDNKEVLSA